MFCKFIETIVYKLNTITPLLMSKRSNRTQARLLEEKYAADGLLIYPENSTLNDARRRLKSIPNELPRKQLSRMLTHYKVLPLIEQIEIYKHADK